MRHKTDKRVGTEAGPYGMTESWYVVGRGALCAPAGGHMGPPLPRSNYLDKPQLVKQLQGAHFI